MQRSVRLFSLASLLLIACLASFARETKYYHLLSPADTGTTADPGDSRSGTAVASAGSLLRFDATYGKNSFELIWNTVSDRGCDHFEIERSFDGQHFEKQGDVKGIGPCTRKDNFFFRDDFRASQARNRDFYYRLKQVELDGKASYSKVLIARVYNSRSLAAMSITPDPDLNDILVNVQLKENSYVVMKLTDKDVNEVIRRSAKGNNGLNIFKLDGSSQILPGTYGLEVIVNSKERLDMKLVKS